MLQYFILIEEMTMYTIFYVMQNGGMSNIACRPPIVHPPNQTCNNSMKTLMSPCTPLVAAYSVKFNQILRSFLHMDQHGVPSTFLLQLTL